MWALPWIMLDLWRHIIVLDLSTRFVSRRKLLHQLSYKRIHKWRWVCVMWWTLSPLRLWTGLMWSLQKRLHIDSSRKLYRKSWNQMWLRPVSWKRDLHWLCWKLWRVPWPRPVLQVQWECFVDECRNLHLQRWIFRFGSCRWNLCALWQNLPYLHRSGILSDLSN